jgi:glycosyltransferase involved in cell wall biosynthesis
MNRTAIIVPVYNHPTTIGPLVDDLVRYEMPLILINDGSEPHCSRVLSSIADKYASISLIERPVNGGKGAAVKTGIRRAAELGYTHVIQIDADGQHDVQDVSRLIALSNQNPNAVISGAPCYRGVPTVRYYARYLTHLWVWINTLSMDIKDAMCGLRLYPLASTLSIIDSTHTGNRMDFDPEILVRLHWSDVPVIQFETLVCYPDDGISHFRGLEDNLLISWAHTRLFFGMCCRLPHLLQRKWSSLVSC